MKNPLLLAECFISIFEGDYESELKDFALENLILLIGNYGLEYEDYYRALYDYIRLRKDLSLKVLKILEISLRNRKLSSSTINPFVKLFLRKCLTANASVICWLLGLVINLIKRNRSISDILICHAGFKDKFDEDLKFEEAQSLEIRCYEVELLRK